MNKTPQRSSRKKHSRPAITTTATINYLNSDGVGVARHENKELLVAGTLPTEEVKVTIEHQGQRRSIGHLTQLLKKSDQRVIPGCSLSDNCPGCPLIHMGYPYQLRYKEQTILTALRTYPSLKQLNLNKILAAQETFGYRTTAKLAVAKHQGKASIGLYKRGTHEVVDIGNCPQQHPLINKVVQAVREEIEKQDVYVYNPITRRGLLRYLAVRVSPANNKALVTLVCAQRNYREMTHLAKWIKKKVPEIIGVHQNINASSGNVVFGTTTVKILGGSDLIDTIGDIRLRLSPSSFFQVNHAQASRIYHLVRDWADLNQKDTAVDLYCGVGGIAMHLASSGGKIIGIEINPEAIYNAKAAAQLNNLNNCRFIAEDASIAIKNIQEEVGTITAGIVNPPRSGCDEEVLTTLTSLNPQRLIYVSCNPTSLARDLDILSRMGYVAVELQPVDMFPQTPHVESVVRLIKSTDKWSSKKENNGDKEGVPQR
ncbi:MAG: 23S rRNA (uracil(1939)-C(5))-methyltransferase RlmD [Desulfobacteraceae bacterium 4572_35.1]|nr:MAG: 23S rRNA (uracil(1939)-C(5))-methyltransferase RlmD [Desulfobacteraceae bacterium 4572_35.1]